MRQSPVRLRQAGRSASCVAIAFAILLLASPVAAQEIENYLSFMPKAHARAIEATPASIALALFGDPDAPGYEDVAPVDGIDDSRNLCTPQGILCLQQIRQ